MATRKKKDTREQIRRDNQHKRAQKGPSGVSVCAGLKPIKPKHRPANARSFVPAGGRGKRWYVFQMVSVDNGG